MHSPLDRCKGFPFVKICVVAIGEMHFSVCITSVVHTFFILTKNKEELTMADYKTMYFELFNKITDVIEELKSVQQRTEEIYIAGDCKEDTSAE